MLRRIALIALLVFTSTTILAQYDHPRKERSQAGSRDGRWEASVILAFQTGLDPVALAQLAGSADQGAIVLAGHNGIATIQGCLRADQGSDPTRIQGGRSRQFFHRQIDRCFPVDGY